ncbi:MAG TPA: hypothetical protein PK978_00260 [Paludibacter sp.]|nr:hypothetical protein [Paludibacter sp.]
MNKKKSILAITIAILVLVAGCYRILPVQISELYEDTYKYQNKEIVVKGEVGESISILGFSGFVLNDGTGDLLVVGYSSSPTPGDVITARGTLLVPFRFQKDFLLVLNVESRNVKRRYKYK